MIYKTGKSPVFSAVIKIMLQVDRQYHDQKIVHTMIYKTGKSPVFSAVIKIMLQVDRQYHDQKNSTYNDL